MAEHLVPLKKASGGATITGPDGGEYAWKKAGDVVEVPYELAVALLSVPDGGYEVADGKKAAAAAKDAEDAARAAGDDHADAERRQVPEPAPGVSVADRIVTEPAPTTEGQIGQPSAKSRREASPITPKPRGGTRRP